MDPPLAAAPAVPAHPWDGFLTGPENELAFAGAQALSRGEREGISPMVVYGPSGVGKSRLLAGLVAEWLRRRPGTPVAHLPASEFADACQAAARPEGDGWNEVRDRFRTVGLLVLEDLEAIERFPTAQEELVHTLDALDADGAAVAVSARTAPGQWPRSSWTRRLRNRLAGGLTVRLDPPGLASLRRYLLEAARGRGLNLSAEAIESLAGSADGYRTLDGWLARLDLEARVAPGGTPPGAGERPRLRPPAMLDLPEVHGALAEETDLAAAGPTIAQIARTIAGRFGVRLSALRGPGRQAAVVQARHLAMHLARLHTGASFAAIGAYFGGRDPATVRHACKAAADRMAADPSLAAAASLPGRAGR
jgi:chromosomal replication initiator protein